MYTRGGDYLVSTVARGCALKNCSVGFYFDLLKPKSIFWSGIGVPMSPLSPNKDILKKGTA